jgi:hypothetical protein
MVGPGAALTAAAVMVRKAEASMARVTHLIASAALVANCTSAGMPGAYPGGAGGG